MKNKNNYTVSAPRHPKKVSQHATSVKMHSPASLGGYSKTIFFYKNRIKKNKLQMVNAINPLFFIYKTILYNFLRL